jgi:glycosyltransferase involved in cell wall biosynthesis
MYDCVRYVGESIESVLGQTCPPAEVIVVDDGSTDGGLQVAQRYEPAVTVLTRKHGGIGAARNSGIQLAAGEFLAFQDADDIWFPQKLEEQMKRFRENPELDFVYGDVRQFYSSELDVSETERAQMREKIFSVPIAGTCLFRRSSFDRVGSFREDVRIGEFVDWLARADDLGLRSEGLRSILIDRRIHDTNTGVRERHLRGQYARVLRDVLERRRAASAVSAREDSGDQSPKA